MKKYTVNGNKKRCSLLPFLYILLKQQQNNEHETDKIKHDCILS